MIYVTAELGVLPSLSTCFSYWHENRVQYGFIVNWRIALTMVNTGKLIDDENGALSKKCELNDVQPKRWRGGESEETTASALILGLWQVRLKLCNHLPFFFIICIMVMILLLPPPSSSSSSSYFLLTFLTFYIWTSNPWVQIYLSSWWSLSQIYFCRNGLSDLITRSAPVTLKHALLLWLCIFNIIPSSSIHHHHHHPHNRGHR